MASMVNGGTTAQFIPLIRIYSYEPSRATMRSRGSI
jgi:hypothetical protein